MITEGKPDYVVAFKGGRGTADMIRKARAAGLVVINIKDDTWTDESKPIKNRRGL
jgi:hypothetical protein